MVESIFEIDSLQVSVCVGMGVFGGRKGLAQQIKTSSVSCR